MFFNSMSDVRHGSYQPAALFIENPEANLSVIGMGMVQFGLGAYSMSTGLVVDRKHPEVTEAESYMIKTNGKWA